MNIRRFIILSLIFCMLLPSQFAFAQEHEHDFNTLIMEDEYSIISRCAECGEEWRSANAFLSGSYAYGEGENVYFITLKQDGSFEAHLKEGEYSGSWLAQVYAVVEENETLILELYFFEENGEEGYEFYPISLLVSEAKYNGETVKSEMVSFDYSYNVYSYMREEDLTELEEITANAENYVASGWVSEKIVSYGSTEGEFSEEKNTEHRVSFNEDGTFSGSGPIYGDISGTWTVLTVGKLGSDGGYNINLEIECAENPDISAATLYGAKTKDSMALRTTGENAGFAECYFVPEK